MRPSIPCCALRTAWVTLTPPLEPPPWFFLSARDLCETGLLLGFLGSEPRLQR
jgi:hypothetical protein